MSSEEASGLEEFIEPEGTISVRSSKAHIPASIRRGVGYKKIGYVNDAKTTFLFNPDTLAVDVLKSLDVIRQKLELRIVKRKRKVE